MKKFRAEMAYTDRVCQEPGGGEGGGGGTLSMA